MLSLLCHEYLFFFFQAEDGIRDIGVTGVQTCALPISLPHEVAPAATPEPSQYCVITPDHNSPLVPMPLNRFCRYGITPRSEERRVGKECRSRWSGDHYKKKKRRKQHGAERRKDQRATL